MQNHSLQKSSAKSQPEHGTGRLRLLYIISLSAIACLSILGQILVQSSLKRQELDIQVISIAQRQQIVCGRLTKTALSLRLASNPIEHQQHSHELHEIIIEWEKQRLGLQKLVESANMGSARSAQVRRMTEQMTPSYQMMLGTARELMLSGANNNNTQPRLGSLAAGRLAQLLFIEKTFVREVDRLILEYNQQVAAGVTRLKQLEMGLLGVTLLALILEGVFIFHPAEQKIRASVAALAKSLQETQETAKALAAEKEKSEHLLLNILPQPIAQRLKNKPTAIADGFAEVTVLFADIVGFTQLSTQVSPQELVALLNEIFSAFDELAEKHNLEKIKTIGDAYMVVGGLPTPRSDHAQAIVEMALDMQQALSEFNTKTGYNCSIRIGINTGPVVAGVIGIKKFIYDLWGDTVNTASRMESHSIPGGIQITEATYAEIKDKYILESRGLMQIKGKGEMQTYFVIRRKQVVTV
jgi:adenylate cyclase